MIPQIPQSGKILGHSSTWGSQKRVGSSNLLQLEIKTSEHIRQNIYIMIIEYYSKYLYIVYIVYIVYINIHTYVCVYIYIHIIKNSLSIYLWIMENPKPRQF